VGEWLPAAIQQLQDLAYAIRGHSWSPMIVVAAIPVSNKDFQLPKNMLEISEQ
jgi:hypothetical protein